MTYIDSHAHKVKTPPHHTCHPPSQLLSSVSNFSIFRYLKYLWKHSHTRAYLSVWPFPQQIFFPFFCKNLFLLCILPVYPNSRPPSSWWSTSSSSSAEFCLSQSVAAICSGEVAALQEVMDSRVPTRALPASICYLHHHRNQIENSSKIWMKVVACWKSRAELTVVSQHGFCSALTTWLCYTY